MNDTIATSTDQQLREMLEHLQHANTELRTLRKALRWAVNVYMVNDEAWDRDLETEATMKRVIDQHGR